jgi:hypothetical protein
MPVPQWSPSDAEPAGTVPCSAAGERSRRGREAEYRLTEGSNFILPSQRFRVGKGNRIPETSYI